jgi:serine/threonine protein kinase
MFKSAIHHFGKRIVTVLREQENSHAVYIVSNIPSNIPSDQNKTVMKIVKKGTYSGTHEHWVSLIIQDCKPPNTIPILGVYEYSIKTNTFKTSKPVLVNDSCIYNYVKGDEYIDEDGYYVIEMKYYPNDLRSILKQKYVDDNYDTEKEDDWIEIHKWCKQIFEVLEYIHDMGLVHMDVKPCNFVIDGHGDLYLIDFGLTTGNSPTKCWTGTTKYMAPELKALKTIDVNEREAVQNPSKCDVYSAGLLLLNLRFCYHDDIDIKEVFEEKDNDEWNGLLSHMLEPNPDKRYTIKQCLGHDYFKKIE